MLKRWMPLQRRRGSCLCKFFCGERPCNSGTAPYSHANVLNLRVSGEGISVAGGISSLADEPRNEQARVGMLATIECSGHLPEPA